MVVDVTVVVLWKTPVVVVVTVVVAGTTTVLDTTTVTTKVEVEGTAALSVTSTQVVPVGNSIVMVVVPPLTALMQEQADEYSSKLGQLEAMGYSAEEEDVTAGSAEEGVVSVAEGEGVTAGVDAVGKLDEDGLQSRFLWPRPRFLFVGCVPADAAVTTSVTVVMLVAE